MNREVRWPGAAGTGAGAGTLRSGKENRGHVVSGQRKDKGTCAAVRERSWVGWDGARARGARLKKVGGSEKWAFRGGVW